MSYTKNGVEYSSEVKDVAKKYNYTDAHVRELARNKQIPSVKVGRRYWFNMDEVENTLVQDNSSTPEASEAYSESNDYDEDLIADL